MTLIDRLSKLDGPDREVDAEICIALQYVTQKGAINIRRDPYDKDFKDEWLDFEVDGDLCTEETPCLTASVDAAIALAEKVLPDHDYIIGKTNGGLTVHAQVGPNEMEFGATPAIALCIAILRAKEASHGE